MINRGIYIIIIGIILYWYIGILGAFYRGLKLPFLAESAQENFGVTTKRKNPFFAPLRPKGHICLSAEDF